MTELTELVSRLDAVEKGLTSFSPEDRKEYTQKFDALTEQQHKLMQQIAALEQKSLNAQPTKQCYKSIGQQFVESEAFKSYVAVGKASSTKAEFDYEERAEGDPMLTDTTAPNVIQPYVNARIVEGALRPLTIESILPSVTISSNAFTYTKEKTFTNNAGYVAEGAAPKWSSVEIEQVDGKIVTVAHLAKVSRQLLEDLPLLQSYINVRMVYGVDLKVEDELINGLGGSGQLAGLLATGNYTPHEATLADLGGAGANLADLLEFAGVKAEEQGVRPTHIIMHPRDWSAIRLKKDNEHRYLFPNALTGTTFDIGGKRVHTSQGMPRGKFLVLDPIQAGMVYNRLGIRLSVYEQDADNAQRGLLTIRCERRIGFAVEKPAAIVGGDLAVPAA